MANLPLKSTLTFNKLIWLSSAGDPDTGPTDRMAKAAKEYHDLTMVMDKIEHGFPY